MYRLYYIEKLRAKIENASLVFGSVMHLALAEYFRRTIDPLETFLQDWDALKDVQLRFSQKESWQKLRDIGYRLLEKFLRDEAPKIGQVVLGRAHVGIRCESPAAALREHRRSRGRARRQAHAD